MAAVACVLPDTLSPKLTGEKVSNSDRSSRAVVRAVVRLDDTVELEARTFGPIFVPMPQHEQRGEAARRGRLAASRVPPVPGGGSARHL